MRRVDDVADLLTETMPAAFDMAAQEVATATDQKGLLGTIQSELTAHCTRLRTMLGR